MSRKEPVPQVLVSFVGFNDQGRLSGKKDGAILSTLKKRKFNEINLLYNQPLFQSVDFKKIAEYIKKEILKRKLCQVVKIHEFFCDNPIEHNEIYPTLRELCKTIQQSNDRKLTAMISSGTPSMQVCWILLAESGELEIKLIRCNPPEFKRPIVENVKLSSALPKIISRISVLEDENKKLKKENEKLLPKLIIDLAKGELKVGSKIVPLSPIEFSYYRYFLNRKINQMQPLRLTDLTMPVEFLQNILNHHTKSFPASSSFRMEIESMLSKNLGYAVTTFRGNVSKLNKKLLTALNNPSLAAYYQIEVSGKRHSKHYSININPTKIKILN